MDREQNILINELTQGKALAKQLRNHLNPSSSPETREFLVQKILCSYEKALSVLNYGASLKPNLEVSILESPCSFRNSSPRSEASDQDSKDVYKKRKTVPRWTEQVKVCSGTGLEGPLDDGYCWRKYGQKDIHGANFPRGYYRCTHRHAQGCLATKQVQRSDEDPTIFEVTYRGRHTCSQNSHLAMASTSTKNEVPIEKKNHHNQQQEHEENPKQGQEVMLNFGTDLKVKTEDLNNEENIFPSFSFPHTSIGQENVEDDLFSETMMENNFMGSFSPTFISPATSESNYLSMSPCNMNNNFGVGHNVQTPESDLTDIISTPTSVTNSPFGDFDFSPNFQFDNLDCFT
ncbi:putative WRKY transcription factor [Melia azedarach]|uniref:WRKY transcription factor n=1 Tax=Melia azedarach TaxID=155640 RepID=A0ACC1YXE6_MELAZ|nr:putative WRKY transcription factor [Melia azedarach]